MPRYRCKFCLVYFDAHTDKVTRLQHKPGSNQAIFESLCSGVTLRRTAKNVGVSRRTVAKKLAWMAKRAREEHDKFLLSIKTSFVMFDEMETCTQSTYIPVSIALAIRVKTGQILGVQTASMNCHGKTAAASRLKFGKRADTRQAAASKVMNAVAKVANPVITIATDQKKSYWNIIDEAFPDGCFESVTHQVYPSRAAKAGSPDPLYRLNQTCAKLRADLARLRRKTWSISKDQQWLQDHLDLYVAYNNGYKLF